MAKKVKEEYVFDEASVKYAELSDEKALEQVQKVKDRIAELKTSAEISEDPRKVFELRELYSSLSWYRMNKNRSRYFKIISSGASMRKAKRHPDGRSFKRIKKARQER